jgi:serine/threonine-protein kinase
VDLTVSTGKPDVVVPYVLGEDKEAARQKMTDAGLRVKLVRERSDEDKDTVTRTDPNAAESVTTGSLVKVYYSAGPTKVPLVVGLTEDEARSRLEKAGFTADTVLDATTPSTKGLVLKQSPTAATTQPQGTTVVITVSDYSTPSPSPTETPSESGSPSESPSGSSSSSGSSSPSEH